MKKKETDQSSSAKKEMTPAISFEKSTNEEIATYPNLDSFTSTVADAAEEIGVVDITEVEIGNYDELSDVYNLSVKCKTETSVELIIDAMYISFLPNTEWEAISIIDYNTGHYYWIPEEQRDFVDIYDYKSGKLISKKTKDFEDYDALEEFNKVSDEVENEFNKRADEIIKKYNDTSN